MPQIDSVLAAHGMRFGRVWAAPSCSPTRAAMLTGRCGSRNGIGQVIPPRGERPMPGLDRQVELLPGLLRLAPQPYASAAIGNVGKDWHLAGTNDFNGDGTADLLWRQDGGTVGVWLMNGATITSSGAIAGVGYTWHILNGEQDRPPVLYNLGPC